jgi:hypothetical protein
MSALGHKRTCAVQEPMSALPPKATSKAAYEGSCVAYPAAALAALNRAVLSAGQ